MGTVLCLRHFIQYDPRFTCPECRLDEERASRRNLLKAQSDAQEAAERRHHEAREWQEEAQRKSERQREREEERMADALAAVERAEHATRNMPDKRFNPGDYKCEACKFITLLFHASRCPVCHADVRQGYWSDVLSAEQKAREATVAAEKAATVAKERAARRAAAALRELEKAASTVVTLALDEARRAMREEKRHKSKGLIGRLLRSNPDPNVYRVDFLPWHSRSGQWVVQPILRIAGMHFRFATPYEYIAALKPLRDVHKEQEAAYNSHLALLQGSLTEGWTVPESHEAGDDPVKPDYSEALERYQQGAAQGDAPSQHELGRMCANGQGVPQSFSHALSWYRKAAAQGYAPSRRNLGRMYANGEAVEQSDSEALRWYRMAADQGDSVAQFEMGRIYYSGRGVDRDHQQALRWYRKAADQGDTDAVCNIGHLYAAGEGVQQDDHQALHWFRKAADQGLLRAQCEVGRMYRKGHGVAQDREEAVKWYRKAAAQGSVEAQFNLDLIGGKFDK